MNYSELLQLAKGWSNFKFGRIIIWRLRKINEIQVHNIEKNLSDIINKFEEMRKDLLFILSEDAE